MNLFELGTAISAVCPSFEGVAIIDASDRSTWRLDIGPGATDAERQAAQQAMMGYVDAAPVPEVISDKQCFQQLAILGKVTQAEALAAVKTGAMPDAVTNGIAALPAEEQFAAEMAICGATQFYRSNPLTPVFLAFLGLSAADGDALWRVASLL